MTITGADVVRFLAATATLDLVPGAGLVLLVRWTGHSGRAGGWTAAAGAILGLCTYLALALTGVSERLARAPMALEGIQGLGAVYLLLIGARTVMVAVGRPEPTRGEGRPPTVSASPFVEAMVAGLLNPKALLVYVALGPAFLPAEATTVDFLTLGVAHVVMVAGWMLLLVELIVRLGRRHRTVQRSRVLTGACGVVLTAYGIVWMLQ